MGNAHVRPFFFPFNYDWYKQTLLTCPIKVDTNNPVVFKNSYCQIIDHQDKEIGGICINRNCKAQDRMVCMACVIEKLHSNDQNHDVSDYKTESQINQIIQKFKEKCLDMFSIIECHYWIEELKLWDQSDEVSQLANFIELNQIRPVVQDLEQSLLEMSLLAYLQFYHQTKRDLFLYLDQNYRTLNQLYSQMEIYKIKRSKNFKPQIDQYKKLQYEIKLENMKKNKLELCSCIQKSKLYQQNLLDQQSYNFIMVQIELLLKYAKKQQKSEHFEIAFEIFIHVINYGPQFENGHLNIGKALHKQKDYPMAIRHFLEAIKINKRFYKAYYALGNIKQKFSQIFDSLRKILRCRKNAEKCFENKLKSCKNFQQIGYYNILQIGNIFLFKDDYKNTLNNYINAQNLSKHKTNLNEFRIKIDIKIKRLYEAKKQQDKNIQGQTLKFYIQHQKNKLPDVVKIFNQPQNIEQIILKNQLKSTNAEAFYTKANELVIQNHYKQAIQMYEKAQQNDEYQQFPLAECSILFCRYKINYSNDHIDEFKNLVNQHSQKLQELKLYGSLFIQLKDNFIDKQMKINLQKQYMMPYQSEILKTQIFEIIFIVKYIVFVQYSIQANGFQQYYYQTYYNQDILLSVQRIQIF